MKYNMPHVKSLPLSWLIACFRQLKLLRPEEVKPEEKKDK